MREVIHSRKLHSRFISSILLLLTCPLLLWAQSTGERTAHLWRGKAVRTLATTDHTQPEPNPNASFLGGINDQLDGNSEAAVSTRWQQLAGPETGLTSNLVVKGNRIFLGTTGGIFISDDNGRNWRRSNSPARFSYGLVSVGNVVLTGTDPFDGIGGVIRSTDNGASWHLGQKGLPPNSGMFYLGVQGHVVFGSTGTGKVFRSDDAGVSWQNSSNGLPQTPGRHQLAASDFGLVIQYPEGLFRSNNGNNWTPVNLNLPVGISAYAPTAIRHVILVATDGAGVYRSDDGGQYWYAPNHGLPEHAVITNLHTDNDNAFCTTEDGTLYTSTDLGKTWIPRSPDFGIGKTFFGSHCIAQSGTSLLAATWDGIFRSTDQGVTWRRSNTGLRAAELPTRIAAQGRRIYAASQGGIWASEDKGKHWTRLNNGIAPLAPGSQGGGGIAVVGRALFAGIQFGGLYRSYNQGRTWQHLKNGLPTDSDPFVIRSIRGRIYVGMFSTGAFASNDGGETWEQLKDLPNDAGFFDFRQVGDVILAGSYGAGMFRSTDNGQSWKPFADGLASDYINDILVIQNTVFTGTDDGIFRLRADGMGWEEVKSYSSEDTNGANSLAFVSGVIYATTYGKGIWASHDMGTTWQPMNRGMLTDRSFFLSLIDGDLYVGSSGNGIFVLPNSLRD